MSREPIEGADLAYRQALVYAEELGELYRLNSHRAAELREKREAEGRIRNALEGNILDVVFQPIRNLGSGKTAAYESLARFQTTPPRPPNIWFEEAESVGLQAELELLAALLALARLQDLPDGLALCINLSPATIVTPLFREVFESYEARRLVLEVTEHARVDDYELLQTALRWYRQLGGRLAVDDAGAGFASLRHILSLEPDLIKVDLSLTRDIDTDKAKRSLAKALIGFAEDIGATIVAEGIETSQEMLTLRELGVRYGQGYKLARPGPLEAFTPRSGAGASSF